MVKCKIELAFSSLAVFFSTLFAAPRPIPRRYTCNPLDVHRVSYPYYKPAVSVLYGYMAWPAVRDPYAAGYDVIYIKNK